MDKTSLTAINKWMFFIYNYPHDFIEQIWGDDKYLVLHLKGKFANNYEYYGAYGCIPAFYGELSSNNRIKMMDWVMKNFDGEQELRFND